MKRTFLEQTLVRASQTVFSRRNDTGPDEIFDNPARVLNHWNNRLNVPKITRTSAQTFAFAVYSRFKRILSGMISVM
jgi:hypothetical protein